MVGLCDSERTAVRRTVCDRIRRNGQQAMHLPLVGDIVVYLKSAAREGDLVVTMGAGNVWEIGRQLVQ